jgi:hypothetical protein
VYGLAHRIGVAAIEDRIEGDRLRSLITYDDGSAELMDFEVYTPERLSRLAISLGYQVLETCCWWDSTRLPSASEARYQMTLERPPVQS